MTDRPHRWVDDEKEYLTAAEIKAARLDDEACTARKLAEAAQPKPPTQAEELSELRSRLDAQDIEIANMKRSTP